MNEEAQPNLVEALRSCEDRYSNLFDAMIEGFCIIEIISDDQGKCVDFRYIEVNPAFEEQTGFHQAKGKLISSLAPDIEPFWLETYGKVAMSGQPARFENQFKSINRWYEVSAYRVGRPEERKVAVFFNDITERRLAEEALRSSQSMLKSVMGSAPVGIFWKDRSSTYLGCNEVFAKAVNMSPEEIAGKTDYDLPWLSEQAESYREYDRRIMEKDSPEYHIIEQMREADGKLTWVETNKVPLHDAGGKVIGILGTYEDITERKQAEEALRQSEERFRNLVETTSDWVWEVDENTVYTYVSPRVRELLGYEPHEVLGKTPLDLMPQDEAQRVGNVFGPVLAAQKPFNAIVNANRHKDGHIVILETSGVPIFGPTGQFRGFRGIDRDITDRKSAEDNQAMLTKVLQVLNRVGDWKSVIHEAIEVIRSATGFDAVGIRLRRGDDCPYFEQSGLSEEFLREENFLCERGGDGQIIRGPDGGAMLECTCGLVLLGRTDPSMPFFTKGGSFWTNASDELLAIPLEADPRINPRNRCIHIGYQSVGLFPIRSGDQIAGLLQLNDHRAGRFTPELVAFYETLAQNIGLSLQRASVQEALSVSEEKYRSLFESIDEGFCIIEMIYDENQKPVDYRFLEVSPSFEKQTGLVNVKGKRMRELTPKHEQHWFDTYGRIAMTGQPERFQNQAEQLHRWYDVYAFRVGRQEDRQVAILFNDITARKQAQEELRKAKDELELRVTERTAQLAEMVEELKRSNEDLERFAYISSHDLQEPVRMVSMYMGMLSRQYKNKLDAEAGEYINFAMEGAQRIAAMIKDLLEYSRISRKEQNLEPTDTGEVVRRVLDILELLIYETHAEITVDPLPTVLVDETQIRQVFQNLIENAIKYRRKDVAPKIHIWAEQEDGQWLFKVRDNGIGIAKQYQNQIFHAFKRLHADRSKYPGTGIGLAIVKRIVERHHGQIGVESKPGEGSTFYFTLPVKAQV